MQRSFDDPDSTELLVTRTASAAPLEEAALAPGTQLGRYRIIALQGRGGMGDVYRAVQEQPVHRTVALKLLRTRRLDARHVAYFELERQLLAQMRHPAIAQIYDAGTTPDGHPYFAMEFIAGSPITQYCDAHSLTLNERIALFIHICEGIQHAHQKGVIHRDLKPGNLLVDEVNGRPLPKIIDFGIATASSLGQSRDVAGTPDYMSPEQSSSDQTLIDTRSDVYSLGVVLSELLTGYRPKTDGETHASHAKTLRLPSQQVSQLAPAEAETLARVRGQALPQMQRVLRRELDWVVAKAMQYDRDQRYPSVAALIDDLQRFLNHLPVLAAPQTRRYLLRKFSYRHRIGITATTLVVLAACIGTATAVYGLVQARTQRTLAEQRASQLEKVVAFQQSMLENMDIEAMGLGITQNLKAQVRERNTDTLPALEQTLTAINAADLARDLIDKNLLASAERTIQSDFSNDPTLAADLRESVSRVYQKLGMPAASAKGFALVSTYRSKALGMSHPATLKALQEQARALLEAARAKEALPLIDTAIAQATALPTNDPLRIKLRMDHASAVAALGDRQRALALLQELHQDAIQLRGESDPITMEVTNDLAILLGRMGDPKAGRNLLERLVPLRTRLLGKNNADTLASLHNLAIMRAMQGDSDGAIELQRELVAIQTQRLGAEHPLTLSELGNLGTMLSDAGQSEASIALLTSVAQARARVLGAEHPNTVSSLLNISSAQARIGQFDKAIALQAKVAEIRTRTLGPLHPSTLFIQLNRAATLYQSGQAKAALTQLDTYLATAQKTLGEKDRQVQMGYAIRAQAAESLGNLPLATVSYRELLKLCETASGADDPTTVDTAWRLEGLLRRQGDTTAASKLRTQYVTPLLQAQESSLSPKQIAMRNDILATEKKEAARSKKS